jgi:uncharacterized protein (DUF3820 family)
MKLPFGKHRGTTLEAVPLGYLSWLWQNVELREPLLTAVTDMIDHRGGFAMSSMGPAGGGQ